MYGFGSDIVLLDGYGWFQSNSGSGIHAPMERRPGHRGLFDMHGNVLEWVHDREGGFGRPPTTDPLGNAVGSFRVFRGGCWSSNAAYCRSAYRYRDEPTYRGRALGFRLALSPVGVPAETGGNKKD